MIAVPAARPAAGAGVNWITCWITCEKQMMRDLRDLVVIAALVLPGEAMAEMCKRTGLDVACDDGRRGVLSGDSIIWTDGTRSSKASQHPSVIIGHKPSVQVGPGVFVGSKGGGAVPLDNPNAPNKLRCAILDGVSYCH